MLRIFKLKGLCAFLNILLAFLFILFLTDMAKADVFCVSNSSELQEALTTAASNGEDDVVKIVQKAYNGNFIYFSDEDYGLTIEGGYTEGCFSRVVDPANTVLDGGGSGTVLELSSFAAVNFSIDGITLKNGMTGRGGGGLYAFADTITLTNNIITGNSAAWGGGGDLHASFPGTITLTNNIITGNSAYHGGGVYADNVDGIIALTSNTITGNSADSHGGGVYVWADIVTLTSNTITGNSADNSGGGVYADNVNGIIALTSNTITGNSADRGGGGIYTEEVYGIVTLTNNIITGNSAYHGGGVYADNVDGIVTLTNNTITGNSADRGGGGIYTHNRIYYGITTLTNNTITNNSAANGGGTYISLDWSGAIANISNNIIWNNTADAEGNDLYIYNNGIVNLFSNDFDQSAEGIYIEIPFTIDPTNLNNEAPLFVDPVNNDYRIQAGSPCVNAGDPNAPELPAADFEGDPRVVGAAPDIGADEYYTGPPVPIPDIKVNGSDGPITLNQSDTLTVTVALDNNGQTDNADWWLAADTPFVLYFYTLYNWVSYTEPAYQGQLFYLDTYEVFSISVLGLEEGEYTLYFGVDTVMDGDVTWGSGYCDTVVVNITE